MKKMPRFEVKYSEFRESMQPGLQGLGGLSHMSGNQVDCCLITQCCPHLLCYKSLRLFYHEQNYRDIEHFQPGFPFS